MIKLDKLIKVADKDYSKVDLISNDFGISKLTAKVLINRGMDTVEKCKEFLETNLDRFHDPFLLADMGKAVDRIITSINNKESIWIYGDYDVDGVTSTSILMLFLKEIGLDINYYIPDRITEGYGLNRDAIDYIKSRGANLIITVDCGITSNEVVVYCNNLGIDVIVTDHHTCGEELPPAVAVINPNRMNNKYPFKKLAGVGVALKLIQGLSEKLDKAIDYDNILPIAAIGTVADVVSLTGENRLIVKNGLERIHNSNNFGINSLLEVTALKDKEISSGHIGFVIGPRINAAGRIGLAKRGVELFLSEEYEIAINIANELDVENKSRQELEERILKQAQKMIDTEIDIENEKVIVVASEGWHPGVIGIVCSRITEKYQRPSIVISIEGNEAKGSARSISTFNIYDGLYKCRDFFIKFGGHSQAAGLSLLKNNIPNFREAINKVADEVLSEEDLIEESYVDSSVDVEDINLDLARELKVLEPFGIGNSSPQFIFKEVRIASISTVGKSKNHIKLCVEKNKNKYECIGFNLGRYFSEYSIGDLVDIIITVDINRFLGQEKLQLNIKSIINIFPKQGPILQSYLDSLDKVIEDNKMANSNIDNAGQIEIISVENRLDYIINEVIKHDNTIVLLNNFYNFCWLIRELRASGRELIKRVDISSNYTKNTNKINIVVSPSKVDTKHWTNNNVIIFDLPIFKEEFVDISNSSNFNIKLLYNKDDMVLNSQLLNSIIPNIEDIRCVYKTFIERKENILSLNTNEYFKYLNRSFSINFNTVKMKLTLDVLKEGSLLEYKAIDGNYIIKLSEKPTNKIDITKLPTVKFFKKLHDDAIIVNEYFKDVVNLKEEV